MRYLHILVVLLALVVTGCSGGGNPTAPATDKHSVTTPGVLDAAPVINLETAKDGSFKALGVLGAYELRIDPEAATAELISKRFTSLGESWIVSGMDYFTVAPCHDCLRIASVSLLADGNLALNFSIKHPFAPGDPSKPPSGKNRLDLNLFDVALVVVPTGATPAMYPLMGAKAYTGFIANNSGYTTELTGVLGGNETAAMPYVLAIDDSVGAASTFNKFAMGATANFDVIFSVPSMPADSFFDLYLTFGYGASAKKTTRLTPTYFNPEFNRKAAWKVKVTPPQGTNPPMVGNTWQHNNATTPYNVKVEVYDWQQGVTTIANPPINPGDIAFASNVASVSVEIPGMNSTLPSATTPTSGAGTPSSPLVFQVPVANQNLLGAGTYIGLVKVTDSRVPDGLPPTGKIDYLIHSEAGTHLFTIPEFATYQTFIATVVVGCGPITGSITSPNCPLINQINGVKIDFSVSANSGNGGDPARNYEVDWDYNGTTFISRRPLQQNGTFLQLGPFTVPNPCASNIPHNFIVAFRVMDSCQPPNQTIFATCTVTVNDCCPLPTITTVVPNTGLQGASRNLTINGTNFVIGPSLGVKLKKAQESDIVATNVVRVNDTQMTCTVAIPALATLGAWDVEATNGCGASVTKTGAFTVTTLLKQTFDSNPSDWTYASYQYWSGCSNPTVQWTANAPFGPSGSGNLRAPDSGNTMNGGIVETVVSPPFDVPTGYSDVYLRVYFTDGFGGGYGGYYNSNWKIAQSTATGISPFNSTTCALPSGGAYLQNINTYGSTFPAYNAAGWCFQTPMSNQPGWGALGTAFPASLDQWFDLQIPSSFFGQTVKVCFQWQTDWCGYGGANTGFAMDDVEIKHS